MTVLVKDSNMNILEQVINGKYESKLSQPLKGESDFEVKEDAYFEDITRLMTQLKTDLLAEEGLTDHPKAEALWNTAWEWGHHRGMKGIALAFANMADLVK